MHTFSTLLRAATAALVPALTLLAAPAASASPQPQGIGPAGTPPGYNATCNCYRNVSYGSVMWFEPTTLKFARQEMDIWMPDARAFPGPRPVVYYGHANTSTHTIPFDKAPESMYSRFVRPLTEAGNIVVSYEFRHPVVNHVPGRRPPGKDIEKAINYFVDTYAGALNADPSNSFITGRSRGGGLGLLTALTGRFTGGTVIRAIRAFQAQTTYDCREAANLFVIPSERDDFVSDCTDVPGAGSALQSANMSAPPTYLGYDERFRYELVRASEVDVHYPDQGLAYCERHVAAGAPTPCVGVDQVPDAEAWAGVAELFRGYRVMH